MCCALWAGCGVGWLSSAVHCCDTLCDCGTLCFGYWGVLKATGPPPIWVLPPFCHSPLLQTTAWMTTRAGSYRQLNNIRLCILKRSLAARVASTLCLLQIRSVSLPVSRFPSARCLAALSRVPVVSPALAAAEGHQSTGPSHPSWRVGRKVGKAPSSDESGSIVPGRAVANVCSIGVLLAVVCSIERKGCGSTLGNKSWHVHKCWGVF